MDKSYDKNFNPIVSNENFQERLKKFKIVDPWSKKGLQEREDFYKIYGRGWWWFNDVSFSPRYKDSWIEQFRINSKERDDE